MTTTTTMAEVPGLRGSELGTSDWHQVTQEHVNQFADATGDHQWIHVDVERATAESPYKGPIAHGYLTLSLLAPLSARGTPWMRRLGDLSDGFASGLMRVRGVRRQRGFDRGFVLSDHADWPALLHTVAETGASRVLATHGHAESLARYLSERGLSSGIIRTAWEGEPSGD